MSPYYNPNTTDPKDELLTHVDENNEVIGGIRREECNNATTKPWHRNVHVYILNSQNEILITRRSNTKDTSPNQLTISLAGHIRYGEDEKDSTKREIKEELGIDTDIKYITTYKIDYQYEREFIYIFFAKTNQEPKLNTEEVSEYMYIDLEKFKEKIKNGDIKLAPGAQEACEMLIEENLLETSNFPNPS